MPLPTGSQIAADSPGQKKQLSAEQDPDDNRINMKKVLLFLGSFIGGSVIYFSSSSKVTVHLHEYVYNLPFKDGRYKVVQGYGGMFSHKNKAALDFEMPVGTPVFAARGGEIYSFKDDSDKGGLSPIHQSYANYIIIRHEDESFGCYWHLQKNGVVVKKGAVEKGQLIGYSGNTGYVLRPHLHFAVKGKLNYDKESFVQTMFRTSKGIEILKKGEVYEKPQKTE